MKIIEQKHANKTETEIRVFSPFPSRPSVKIDQVGAVWQTGRIICQRNIIELVPVNPLPSGRTFGIGMGSGLAGNPFYTFRDVLVHRNFVRPADGASDPITSAVVAHWFENALVQRNIFSGLAPDPLGYYKIGSLHQFSNQTHAGQVVQAQLHFFDTGAPSVSLNQLETELDFALSVGVESPSK